MKKLNLFLSMLVFGSLFASGAYSQATCSSSLNGGSCYANGADLYSSAIYLINCPTGNFRYSLESSCYQGGYLGEAGIWGDIISAYAESYPNQPTDREEGNVSNLDPNNSYTVEMFAWTQGYAYAYASVYGW